MMISNDEGVTYLSMQGGGGGCIVKTAKTFLIGVWSKDAMMSNKKPQNSGDCNDLVERVGRFLKEQGF